jgi:hypothetical protein
MSRSKTGTVYVQLVIDRSVPTEPLLEVRITASPDFDCRLRVEAGSEAGLIDYEVEAELQQGAHFTSTVYLTTSDKLVLRAKAPGTDDLIRFTCIEHASVLERDQAILDNPGRCFQVTMKRASARREYPGKKRSWFLV